MTFHRENLPDPVDYYENTAGLRLNGRGQWRTTSCEFHGGKDSMRINVATGFFKCMNCQESGDVLAYHMKSTGKEFIDAAKDLNCWTDNGQPSQYKPLRASARTMLEVIALEVQIVALIACDIAKDIPISLDDKERLLKSAARITNISNEVLHGQ